MPITITNFSLSNGTLTPDGATFEVTDTAILSGGTVAGPGLLQVDGTTTLSGLKLSGGARLKNDGTLTESGTLTFGGASGGMDSVFNASGGTYKFADGGGIGLASGVTGTFSNSGTLEKVSGTGTNTLATTLYNSATVLGGSGILKLAGSVTNAGTVETTGGRIIMTNTMYNKGTVQAVKGQIDIQGSVNNSGFIISEGGIVDITGAVYNTGTIAAAGGTLEVSQAITGAGRLGVARGGTLQLDSIPFSNQKMGFETTSTGTIAFEAVGKYGLTISNFAAGDTLDLLTVAGAKVESFTEASGGKSGVLVVGTSTQTDTFTLVGSYTAGNFVTGADASSAGTAITFKSSASAAHSAHAETAHPAMSDLGRMLFEATFDGGAATDLGAHAATPPHAALAVADSPFMKSAHH